MKPKTILSIVFGIIFLISLITVINISFSKYDGGVGPTHTEEVECYDEYHNEIIGLRCKEVVTDVDPIIYILIPLSLFSGGIAVSISLYFSEGSQ